MVIHIEVTEYTSESSVPDAEYLITDKPVRCDPVTALYPNTNGVAVITGRVGITAPMNSDSVIAPALGVTSRPYYVKLAEHTFSLKSRILGLWGRFERVGIPFKNAIFRGASSITFTLEINDCEWHEGNENRTVRCVAHIGNHRQGDTYFIRNYGYVTVTAAIINSQAVGMSSVDVEEGKYYPIVEWVEFLDPVYHHAYDESDWGMIQHQRMPFNRIYNICKWVDDYGEKVDYEHSNHNYGYYEVASAYLNGRGGL